MSRSIKVLALFSITLLATPARSQETQPTEPDDPHAGLVRQAHQDKDSPSIPAEPVAKAEAEDAVTVAEAYAQRAQLAGQPVTVRGRVVKFNPSIMNRNWIHLQDGTGTPTAKDFDLTATSQDLAEVGAVVVVHGTLQVDREFGAGYHYAVIVEDATITAEEAAPEP